MRQTLGPPAPEAHTAVITGPVASRNPDPSDSPVADAASSSGESDASRPTRQSKAKAQSDAEDLLFAQAASGVCHVCVPRAAGVLAWPCSGRVIVW